jgi:hypothetical protein
MFPGQLYSRKKLWVSGLSIGTARQKSRAAAERNQSRSTGISSLRCRKRRQPQAHSADSVVEVFAELPRLTSGSNSREVPQMKRGTRCVHHGHSNRSGEPVPSALPAGPNFLKITCRLDRRKPPASLRWLPGPDRPETARPRGRKEHECAPPLPPCPNHARPRPIRDVILRQLADHGFDRAHAQRYL